jgi:hypothetical protein
MDNNNSIEIIDNHWVAQGEDSALDILQDFIIPEKRETVKYDTKKS